MLVQRPRPKTSIAIAQVQALWTLHVLGTRLFEVTRPEVEQRWSGIVAEPVERQRRSKFDTARENVFRCLESCAGVRRRRGAQRRADRHGGGPDCCGTHLRCSTPTGRNILSVNLQSPFDRPGQCGNVLLGFHDDKKAGAQSKITPSRTRQVTAVPQISNPQKTR